MDWPRADNCDSFVYRRAQTSYLERDPEAFFIPSYVGGRGWIAPARLIAERDRP